MPEQPQQQQPTWGDVIAAARRKAATVAADLAGDPRTQEAIQLASALPRRLGLPDPSLASEIAAAVDELVEVVLVQQELIENLMLRMSQLERARAAG